ncbi:hypothetical protein FA13DRAFT_243066 [Coprinellus micaceus]|uniref:Uncharacterized protein n=1 Tax=Coprinellus micaceus TaxID=71717 RepID=A0A4Y7SEV7_COPMI|nr:hypothetical protein FA13DRAFT_243066 [Coprinellus micaceus]
MARTRVSLALGGVYWTFQIAVVAWFRGEALELEGRASTLRDLPDEGQGARNLTIRRPTGYLRRSFPTRRCWSTACYAIALRSHFSGVSILLIPQQSLAFMARTLPRVESDAVRPASCPSVMQRPGTSRSSARLVPSIQR